VGVLKPLYAAVRKRMGCLLADDPDVSAARGGLCLRGVGDERQDVRPEMEMVALAVRLGGTKRLGTQRPALRMKRTRTPGRAYA